MIFIVLSILVLYCIANNLISIPHVVIVSDAEVCDGVSGLLALSPHRN